MMMAIGAELVFAHVKSVSQPMEYMVNHAQLKEFLRPTNWAHRYADSTAPNLLKWFNKTGHF
jgi:hypothetical protein